MQRMGADAAQRPDDPADISGAASAAAAARLYAESYSPELYKALVDDTVRVEAYRKAIAERVSGKRVLDVGTGPVALLAVMAARAGAKHVTAIEVTEAVADQARAVVRREGLEDVIEVVCGFSTQVPLPEVDLVIHELVGDLGSEEGLPLVLADLQSRLDLFRDRAGWVVPRRVSTWVAPISLHLASAVVEDAGSEVGEQDGGAEEEAPQDAVAEEGGEDGADVGPLSLSEVRLSQALPPAALLGERQVLECMDAEEPIDLQPARTLTWKVKAPSTFTGFVCAPIIEFDANNVIDAWDQQTHFRHVAVMLPEGALVEAGDEVRLDIQMDLRAFPAKYTFAASLRASAAVAESSNAHPAVSTTPQQLGTTVISFDLPVEQPLDEPDEPPAKRPRVAAPA